MLCAAFVFFGAGILTAQKADLGFLIGQDVAGATPAVDPSGREPLAHEAWGSGQFVVPVGPESWFEPSGRNGGTQGLADYLTKLALHGNAPLYLSDSWGRTAGGPNSDHHISRSDSWAFDVAVLGVQQPTPATDLAARRIASALGEPGWTDGDLNKTINGYRFQVLWRVAGHFNHVHVGVRKVG